jgi:hypothetical protein
MEAGEVFVHTLPVRLAKSGDVTLLDQWDAGEIAREQYESLIQNDVEILTGWLLGDSLRSLLQFAPTRPRGRFKGTDDERVLDLVEHIGRLAFAGSWVWSGACLLASWRFDDESLRRSAWVSGSLQWGVWNREAITLCELFTFSRDRANAFSRILLDSGLQSATPEVLWEHVRESRDLLLSLGATPLDIEMVTSHPL